MAGFTEVASQFGTALSQRDYSQAHSLLAESLKSQLAQEQLQQSFEGMISGSGDLAVEVAETLTDWPEKQANDVGWAYVAVNGESFSEAVTLTLCDEGGKPMIRNIVWGRP
jgi:hypothetical protein